MDTREEIAKLLMKSRLFKNFSPEVIMAMTPFFTPCRFNSDNMICMKGDPSDYLYLICEGEVEVTVSSRDGKIIVLETLSRGDVFGEVGLLDKGPRTADVTARTDISLYRLEADDFETLTQSFSPGELKAITSYACYLFRRVTNSLEETAFMDADIRIARKIRELYEHSENKNGNSFRLNISQENLGRMAGLSREATNKALSHLEEKGLIQHKYKRVSVPNVKNFLEALKD